MHTLGDSPSLDFRYGRYVAGHRVGRNRILRVIRHNHMLPPHSGVGHPAKAHDSRVCTDAPNVRCATCSATHISLIECSSLIALIRTYHSATVRSEVAPVGEQRERESQLYSGFGIGRIKRFIGKGAGEGDELHAGKQAALIGVEYLRFAVPLEGSFQHAHAKCRVSTVLDNSQANIHRLCQSITAHRYKRFQPYLGIELSTEFTSIFLDMLRIVFRVWV